MEGGFSQIQSQIVKTYGAYIATHLTQCLVHRIGTFGYFDSSCGHMTLILC